MLQNNKGLTLIEVLISMLIILVVSLALMQTAIIGIDTNMKNILRDEAINIAENEMNGIRNRPVVQGTETTIVTKNLRDITNFPFTVTRDISGDLGYGNHQITVTVTWNYRGNLYSHRIITILQSG